MAASVAIDLQEIDKNIDGMDATDPTDRNLQSMYNLACVIGSGARAIAAPGTGYFQMPKHVALVDRAAYESIITNIQTATADLVIALQSALGLT